MNDCDNPYASPREQGAALSDPTDFPVAMMMTCGLLAVLFACCSGAWEMKYGKEPLWFKEVAFSLIGGEAFFAILAGVLNHLEKKRKETP